MPYSSKSDLPENVKGPLSDVPHAQEIYKEAYNNAYEQYKDPDKRREDDDREETAHKVAWNAVKEKYEKGDDDKWHPKN